MALELGELSAVISVDDAKFKEGLRKGKAKFKDFGHDLKVSALAAGAAAGAAFGAALPGALEMTSAKAKLRNQLGDPAAADAAAKAAAAAYGRGFSDSVGDAMETATAVISSGLAKATDTGAIEDLSVKTQALARTFDLDLAKAAEVAGVMMKSGLAKNGTEALDLIAAASRRVPAELREDVLDAAEEYSQFFDAIGFSGNQALTAITNAAKDGRFGLDKMGDAIKEFGVKSTDMSSSSQAAYKTLGLNAHKMSNDLLAGGATAETAFGKIVSGLMKIKDPATQANTAIALFGTPLEDMGVNDIPAFLAALDGADEGMGNVAGTAAEMADVFEQDAGQQVKALGNQVKAAFVEKMAQAIPYIKDVAGFMKEHSAIIGPLVTGLGAFAVAIYAITTAMKIWSVVQVVLNLALWTSPITWIVLAVVALVAVIVIIATKTNWLQTAWKYAWSGIKTAAEAVGSWFVNTLWKGWILGAWHGIVGAGAKALDWFKSLPGRIKRAFMGLANIITAPYRFAFNKIAGLWNGTIGRLSWTVPTWVPKIGGNSLSAPKLPHLAGGGVIDPRPGGTLAVLAEAGRREIATPEDLMRRIVREETGGSQGAMHRLIIEGTGILRGIRREVRLGGGQAQTVLVGG